MATKQLPEQDRLRQLLAYDPHAGILTWRARDAASFHARGGQGKSAAEKAKTWNTVRSGNPAMETLSPQGYFRGFVDGTDQYAHRVIWKWWHGSEPEIVDHINGNRADNRIVNLRNVTRRTNVRNTGMHRRNTSGRTGVAPHGDRWRAVINVERKRLYLGTFDTFEQASAARSIAEAAYGFGPNHGAPSG